MDQHHLELLRKEHIQLQQKYAELKRQHDILIASDALNSRISGSNASTESTSFVVRLLDIVTQLYDKDLYSDITIHVDGRQLRGHRFVIAARTNYWGDLSSVERIDFTVLPFNVAQVLLKWVYTDLLDECLGDTILLPLLEAALKYRFEELKTRCESLLIARIDVENCIRVYQFADANALERLRDCCAEVVSARWTEFQPQHFDGMPAQLLYKLLKRKSTNLVSSIIRLRREDVLFLFLIENSSQLKCLNEPDHDGRLPLDLAFDTEQLNLAKCLVQHGANLNALDAQGHSFLWKAVHKGSVEVCDFLVENEADVNYVHARTGDTLLHALAQSKMPAAVCEWAERQIEHFDMNAVDREGRTPLIVAIEECNDKVVELLLAQSPKLDVNAFDSASRCAIGVALLEKGNMQIAEQLVSSGADLNVKSEKDGQTLFHKAVRASNLAVIQFLAKHGAAVNEVDSNGSSPLHLLLSSLPTHGQPISDEVQLDTLKILLKCGADPSIRESASGCSPLHFAVERDLEVLRLLLSHCAINRDGGAENEANNPPPSLCSTLDREGNSPLWRALLSGKFEAAKLLIQAGANVNEKSADGNVPLIRAINAKRDDIARFLLDNKAIAAVTSPDGFSCLCLAVEQGLTPTVDHLCKLGANLNQPHPRTGLVPLWSALDKGDYGTAEVLVGHGCDTEGWAPNEEDTLDETLLHRCIDRSNQKAAVFLIKSGCNVNVLRAVRETAKSANAADVYAQSKQTPLHAAVQWGLTEVSKALISNLNCRIDAQDADGRTAAHLAVIEQDQTTLELLLNHPDPAALAVRDRYGQTPLALAIKQKYTRMAEAICTRLPHAAVQVNGAGENLLHCAVKASDLESVLFLLGIHVDVKIPTQDQERTTALQICARTGDELILRNLMLAGAEVNSWDAHGRTALSIASIEGHTDICRVLLENGADPNLEDGDGNNALHLAVSNGAVQTTQMLLQESRVNPLAVNKRQQNILHLCAAKSTGIVCAELFLTILEIHPEYPLENADMYGNTMFLLAFINGNSDLCKLALRNGACMGVQNHQGQTVFNTQTPTQQLLFGLLEGLEREPRWAEGELCSECGTRFTLTMRKHHCRHCGRLCCAKCSDQQIPILKYNLAKPMRVCQICFDVMTIGTVGH